MERTYNAAADPAAPEAPVTTPDAPTAPERAAPMDDPDRYYQPERLCPDQRQRTTWRSRP